MTRRRFFDLAGGTAASSLLLARSARAQRAGRGPNDRVRVALIGSGNRGRQVADLFLQHLKDIEYPAVCDVYKTRLDLEIGFYASLPCLLAIKAVREARAFKWDDAARKAVAI